MRSEAARFSMGALLALSVASILFAAAGGCGPGARQEREREAMPTGDINSVMEAHVDSLMAIPGVVGVAIGALDDGRPCIRVLVVRDTRELRAMIPLELDGFPVVIDETGEIRALSDDE